MSTDTERDAAAEARWAEAGGHPERPVQVPPDKAPLRALGDLLGTLAWLQESFGELSNRRYIPWGRTGAQQDEDYLLLAGLIATAVQQSEALPKPEGDLGAWAAEGFLLLSGFNGPLAGRMRDHLAAMPAQPDVNAGLLGALCSIRETAGHDPTTDHTLIKIQRQCRAAIAATKSPS